MSRVYLSHRACPELTEYLRRRGHTLCLIEDDARYGPGVEAHADLRMCKMGFSGPVLTAKPPSLPSYPQNAAMCALILDGFLIHRLDITDASILKYCRECGYREINVRQGYTRCSCVPVDGRSVITSDPGIFAALSRVSELQVLKIREGFVTLPGFDTGFIGGASGTGGGELLFNGDLSRHPDFEAIRDFVASRGVKMRYFPGAELCDIGSLIEE